MNKKIIWESQHLEIDTKYNTMKYSSNTPSFMEEVEDDHEITNGLGEMVSPDTEQIQSLSMTPFGVFRMDDEMHPFKQFKLWMGHTNFNISRGVVDTIQKVDGVEILRIISRYRFIVGIGKAFDTLTVKQKIEELLCDKPKEKECLTTPIYNKKIIDKINSLTSFLDRYKKWTLLVFPNGNIEFITDQDKQFSSICSTYEKIKDISNGILLTK